MSTPALTRPIALLGFCVSIGLSTAHAGDQATGGAGAGSTSAPRVEIRVTEAGFEPREVKVKLGQATTLAFTRATDRTCMTAIDIPDEDVKGFDLPLNRTVTLLITPKKKGVEPFHCSAMGMGKGRIVVE